MELRDIPLQSNHITTLDQIIDQKYGERGAIKREQWERDFEAFRLEVLLEQATF